MDVPLVYAILAIFMLAFGLDILLRKKGGVQVWNPPFGYKTMYYKGKIAIIIGVITTLFGFVFTFDAIRSLIVGRTTPVLTYAFCAGSAILVFCINIFARIYATHED